MYDKSMSLLELARLAALRWWSVVLVLVLVLRRKNEGGDLSLFDGKDRIIPFV